MTSRQFAGIKPNSIGFPQASARACLGPLRFAAGKLVFVVFLLTLVLPSLFAQNPGNFGQLGGYASDGGSTTIGGWQSLYALNPKWTLTQLNALFSRFNQANITSWSITSNVATFQAINSYSAGDNPALGGFPISTFFNGNYATVLSAGLSNTQFEVAFTHANGSATESGFATLIVPAVGNFSYGTVVIPSGMPENPSTAYVNTGAQTLDWRRGFAFQQISQYGVKCDAQPLYVTITSGNNTVNVGSSLTGAAVGMTMVVGKQTGFGQNGLQQDWEPTVTSYTFPNVQLSANAPFSYTGYVTFGTNNAVALTRAFNDATGVLPLNIPSGCNMLTSTVRWPGTNVIGQQMNYSGFTGFPGQDIFQQQDGTPITAWSIGGGTTTFTIPTYSAHNILVGDVVKLNNFATSTFFNNQTVTIASQPSPTTFTVSSNFGQSSSSSAEAGLAAPTTNVGTNGLRLENLNFGVNNSIDPSFPWNHYDASANLTVEPPMYRPLQLHGQPANNPFGPGWGTGQVNGVAKISQGSSVVCITTTTGPSGNTARIPTVNSTIVFPYQRGGLFSAKVQSNTGSCSSGYVGTTITPALPNTAGFTATQAEWFTFNNPQILAVAIPGSITYPYTIALGLPFPPVPGYESNVSSHGRIEINGDQFDYAGDTFGGTASTQFSVSSVATSIGGTAVYTGSFSGATCSTAQMYVIAGFGTSANNGTFLCSSVTATTLTLQNGSAISQSATATSQTPPPTITLRDGPTSIHAGAGDAVGQIVFPLNPCNAMYSNPWPVVPTLNAGGATPLYATYYPGLCGGNAAMALPHADASAWVSVADGFSQAYFNNIAANPTNSNSLGNNSNNGSMLLYEAGVNTGYGNTFNGLRANYLWGGFMQGPASVNQHGVRAVGPTSSGQTISNCTFRTGYPITLYGIEQSQIDRCDTYSSAVSPYDGSAVGAATALDLSYSLSEQDGGLVTNTAQLTIKDFNSEPENGNHEEIPVSVESDCANCNFIQTIFEGGFNIFGGSYQLLHGTQISNPTFNYGNNNYFEHMFGLNNGYNSPNVYNGEQFYNWGTFSQCEGANGSSGAASSACGPGFVQQYNGHDAFAAMMGNLTHPNENVLGGMILPGEWAGLPLVFDPTELWWGSHAECALSSGAECIIQQFDGFNGYIILGPHQRIADTQYVIKANFKAANSTPLTFNLLIAAENPLGTTCTPNYSLINVTLTANNTWTPVQIPVDFTGYAGCDLAVVFQNSTSTNTLQIGYFNLVPFPGNLIVPLGTPIEGGSCPVAGQFEVDATHLWICAPISGSAFGAGKWKNAPVT